MTDPRRRAFLASCTGLVLAAALPCVRAAVPLVFHDHGHGLAFSPDGQALLAPSHRGVAVYEDGAWWEASGPAHGFSGFAVTERAVYSSGHAGRGVRAGQPFGFARSTDGGRSWSVLALAGEADFYMLAAGYRSGAIYVLNGSANSAMQANALYATLDEGIAWRQLAAAGLAGELHGLAAHPTMPATVAAATGRGLYMSRDGGERFARLDDNGAVTAVAFDLGGERLRYARVLSSEILQVSLDGRRRAGLRPPALPGDYVTCLAQSPVDARVLALATRRRDVYLSGDGGVTWRPIASGGAARGDNAERERE